MTRTAARYAAEPLRNRRLIADYLAGASRAEVARRYGLDLRAVNALMRRLAVVLPPAERSRRAAARSPRLPAGPGRPPVWPDCPAHLAAEYARLRRVYRLPAREARRMLEQDCAARGPREAGA